MTTQLTEQEMQHPDWERHGDRVPVECYTRVVGYVRPVKSFNVGKKLEFADRLEYEVPLDLGAEKQIAS